MAKLAAKHNGPCPEPEQQVKQALTLEPKFPWALASTARQPRDVGVRRPPCRASAIQIDRVVAVNVLQAPIARKWAPATINRTSASSCARPYAPVECRLPALACVACESEPLPLAKHSPNALRLANAVVQQVPDPSSIYCDYSETKLLALTRTLPIIFPCNNDCLHMSQLPRRSLI